MYTEDSNAWWEFEHEFAGYMTTRNRNPETVSYTHLTLPTKA